VPDPHAEVKISYAIKGIEQSLLTLQDAQNDEARYQAYKLLTRVLDVLTGQIILDTVCP